MRFFRWLVALLFAWVIVLWLVRRYQTDQTTRNKDLFAPVRTKIATLVQPRGVQQTEKQTNNPTDTSWDDTQQGELHPDVTQGSLSLESYYALVEGSRILWNEKSPLVLVVYCDYSVWYCNELYESWAVYDYQKILDNDLAIIRKPFPKSPTSATLSSHRAFVCAEKTANEDQLLDLQTFLYTQETHADAALSGEAQRLWIPGFEQCFTWDKAQVTTSIQSQRELAKNLIWLRSLPTLLLYNTNTENRYKIPGWYNLKEIAPTFEYINQAER